MQSRVHILGIPIDPLTSSEVMERLHAFLKSNDQHHCITPNAEMIVAAQKNSAFNDVLNRSDLNIPDSISLLFAAKLTKQHLPERITGVDTVQNFCKSLSSSHSVFLLGAADGVAQKAAEKLMEQNPNLTIAGTYSGSPREEDAKQITEIINASGASVLFVAYGAPAQDMWIDTYVPTMPNVKLAMGVGGTFDFLAGVQKRAPVCMQKMGLEWLWRFVREPRRWKRMFRAVVVFPFLVLISTLRSA